MTVADMNGDGITDIITTSDTDNMVNVLLGSGDGTFRPKVSYTSGVGQREVVAGDFNGDGLSDIATVSFTDKSLNVFLNNGDGTLAAKTSYADGNDSQGLAVADVNGDGKTDIVVSSNLDNNVNVFLGNGDGTFQGKVSYAGGNGPRQVAAADVNGDGVVDLVTASRNDSNADVLLGNSLHGVSALQPFTLTTRDGAKSAMTYFDQVQTRLSTQRSQIGAFQSRAEYVTHVLGASVEATKQAEGRIRDADMAEEVANGTRERILQEMGATVLQHAINDPQLLLQLLHE
ncbi:MAG: VCBS repeat-containing protein [Isosphaeraceae bacterium]|nr:VCBS repeat-containing protein [Isosphaeraceae bacterium]